MSDASRGTLAFDSDVLFAQIALEGKIVSANRRLSELIGYPNGALAGHQFTDIFPHPQAGRESSSHERLIRGEIPCYSSVLHGRRQDGSQLYSRVIFFLQRDSTGRPQLINAIVEDLTALNASEQARRDSEKARREMAQRLTTAQENERTRIARELHDDIGQSLAILRIQMMRAGRPVSGMPGKLHPGLPELSNRLKDIAHKVSRLSHQLHSSELEYLGLAMAVQGHCREFTEKYKLPVECTCENIPNELDRLLALALLRVIQEALHNAAKYSQAKSIEVKLTGSPEHLSLLIVDNGVGFDVEEARLAAGLGLISMRERIKLAGGEFAIQSRPGDGTRITARVPLTDPSQPDTAI